MSAVKKDLASRIKDVLPQHNKTLVPKYERSRLIPDHEKVNLKLPCLEQEFGEFYEILANLWFGGNRSVSTQFFWGGDSQSARNWSPDLVTRALIAEQKGVGKSVTLKLRDTQIASYHDGQLMNPQKRVAWQFFRHDLLDVISREKKRGKVTKGEIYEMLADQTIYGVDLPLSLVTALWHNPASGLSHRRRDAIILDEDGYFDEDKAQEMADEYVHLHKKKGVALEKPYTGVRSSTINQFFFNPEECIAKLDRMRDLFNIERLMSPEGLNVEGFKLKQFPVLKITDKYKILWIHDMVDYFKPERRFSDSDEEVAKNLHLIESEYNAFCKSRGTNGFGYRTSNPKVIERQEKRG
jgi:hypothetical protein